MTIPVWMLLGFATWTALLLLFTIGTYRWTRIFSGTVPIRDFPADASGGADWYRRATRAHANCIENLSSIRTPSRPCGSGSSSCNSSATCG